MKNTFLTVYYKGQYIQISHADGVEIVKLNGKNYKSLLAAKQAVTRGVK